MLSAASDGLDGKHSMGHASNSPAERDCGRAEFMFRHCWSSLFYYTLYRRLHPDHPFFTPRAIKEIDGIIGKDTKVFEWGSGASTLWLARRVGSIVSVEHDPKWHAKGIATLKKEGLANADIIFSPPKELPAGYIWEKDWKHYNVLGHAPRKPEFKAYFEEIDNYPDGHFDLIIIDGRERVGCVLHAIPKLSWKGVIVLDDSARSKYAEIFQILKGREARVYNHGLLQTTLFLRK